MLAIFLQAASAANSPGYSTVVVGGLLSFIGALLLIMLQRVLKQGDVFGAEQARQGTSITKIETTLHGDNGLVSKVNRMHDARGREQEEMLRATIMENAELRTKYEELIRAKDRRTE